MIEQQHNFPKFVIQFQDFLKHSNLTFQNMHSLLFLSANHYEVYVKILQYGWQQQIECNKSTQNYKVVNCITLQLYATINIHNQKRMKKGFKCLHLALYRSLQIKIKRQIFSLKSKICDLTSLNLRLNIPNISLVFNPL